MLDLTVSQFMTREVITIPRDLLLQEAAQILTRSQVSGAPVVDAAGRCVGVLSATDFFRRAAGKGFEPVLTARVAEHMTPDPVAVSPTTPIRDLARMMIDAHIHRVIVVDPEQKPIGIVSSTDILAAVAYACSGR
jgi:CBS domain-containing protein